MDVFKWIQLIVFVGLLLVLTKPMGRYLFKVLETEERTILFPVMGPLEKLFYRLLGVKPEREQNWKEYTLSLLAFSLVGVIFTYAILRVQHLLPLNPQHFGPVIDHLSFNTAVSFATNTNWQSYGGESTLSYFSQMVGLVFHNFVSAAVGICVAAALVRGIARHSANTLGHFWKDLIRLHLYVLVPFCLVYAVFLVSQGVIQNFKPYQSATLVEPIATTVMENKSGSSSMIQERKVDRQSIVEGPIASQVAIKMLGTNGGGYTGANSSHPFENPTPLTNFIEILSIFLIPSGLTYYLGRMVKKQRHGWAIWAALVVLFLLGLFLSWSA